MSCSHYSNATCPSRVCSNFLSLGKGLYEGCKLQLAADMKDLRIKHQMSLIQSGNTHQLEFREKQRKDMELEKHYDVKKILKFSGIFISIWYLGPFVQL
jgi:hypothetical protein